MSETAKLSEMSEQQAEIENDLKIYQEIEYFAQSVYPELVKLSEEITNAPTPKAIETAQNFVDRLRKDTLFSSNLYDRLLNDAELGKTLRHDIATPASTFLLRVGQLSEFTPSRPEAWERFGKSLVAFCKVCPRYFLGLEDIILRRVERAGGIVKSLPFNVDFANRALVEMRGSSEVDRRVKQLFGAPSAEAGSDTEPLQHFPRLAEDERIMAPTGEIMNALFNVIRNASKAEVSADQAACEISRAGNEVVIQVVDNGIGIPGNKLKHIFEKGTSFTGSSGLGLTELDERLAKQKIGFFVASRPRLSQPGDPLKFGEAAVYPENSEEVDRLKSLLADRTAATIFEMRLPITVS